MVAMAAASGRLGRRAAKAAAARNTIAAEARRRPLLATAALATAAAALAATVPAAFAVAGGVVGVAGRAPSLLCGRGGARRSEYTAAERRDLTAVGVGAAASAVDRLSSRDWLRYYRTLGLPEDASRDLVTKATTKLRRKYASDANALERVENANLWITTRMISRKEESMRQRQQANRLREIGGSPKRLFQKYIAGYIPPNIRQMIEVPTSSHFRWTSSLLGLFALMSLCVPTQASSFVGLGAACAMGLIYQRNRPEPVKDDMGNVGEVRKINPKEFAATIALVAAGVALGAALSIAIFYFVDVAPMVGFSFATCSVLWVVALFFKVYQCFDQ